MDYYSIRDETPRTATSTFTQLLSSETLKKKFDFDVALRPQRPYGLLGMGSPGRPPPLSCISRAPLCNAVSCSYFVMLGGIPS